MTSENQPTDRQLEYAADLGVKVPRGATRDEVSILIDEALIRKNPPSEGNLQLVRDLGIELDRPLPKKQLFDHLWAELQSQGRDIDMAALFVYRICRGYVEGGDDHPAATGVGAPAIREIASQLASDPKAMASIKRYGGRQLIWFGRWTTPEGFEVEGGSKRTHAYKEAKRLIAETLGLHDPNDRSVSGGRTGTRDSRKSSQSGASGGCLLGVLATLAFAVAAVALG